MADCTVNPILSATTFNNFIMTEKTKNIIALVLAVLVAAWMVMAGIGKLTGNEQAAAVFIKSGFPSWFKTVAGVLEIVGAIGLFIPQLRRLAAMCLIGLMCGALYTHYNLGDPLLNWSGAFAVIAMLIAFLWLHYDDED